MGGCVFCDIGRGDAPATVLCAWPDAIAITPVAPVTVGHALILPLRHVRDALEDPDVTAMVMRRAAEWATHPCNIITSVGEAATQTILHLHVHVVPRRPDDGLPLPWTPQQARVG